MTDTNHSKEENNQPGFLKGLLMAGGAVILLRILGFLGKILFWGVIIYLIYRFGWPYISGLFS